VKFLGWVLALGVAMQFVPFGHEHTNPPVLQQPEWDSPKTRDLARRACFDCHANETKWPWYSSIAPASWLVQRDVKDGRRHLNFSEWSKPQKHAKDAAEQLESGEMPPWFYLPLHPEAKLTAEEKAALIAGLKEMPGPK
jgi:mono/diheme cytochrome c family protein